MIFNSLTITSFNEQKIYNYYKFNTVGLNVILGQKGLATDETNGVGKTALIECIRYCLGGSLPLCFKNKTELSKHGIFVILEIFYNNKIKKIGRFLHDDSFAYVTDNPQILYTLSLWDMYTQSDFKAYIEKLAYSYNFSNESIVLPGFASVREYLMRDEKRGFQDLGLVSRTAVSVNQILSFLSLIPFHFETNLNLQKKIIKELQNELSLVKEIGKEIKEIRKMHSDTIDDIDRLKKMLETADVSSKIKYDEKKYFVLKERLSTVQQKIHQLEYAKKQHEKNINSLEENIKKIQDIIDLKDFYNQMLDYFPEKLSKNYNQMVNFYSFMIENRGTYFKDQIVLISEKLKPLYAEQNNYLVELSSCTEFVKNSELVIDLRDISNEINDKYKKIAEYHYKIEKFKSRKSIEKKIDKQKEVLEEMTEKYEDLYKQYYINIDNIKKHFYNLNEIAYNEKGVLEFNFENNVQIRANTGRIKIKCSIPDEGAYGRFLMKINMFDIALFMNRVDYNSGLLFLFHDGSYSKPTPSIKGSMMVYIDQYLKEAEKGQYFVTINTEELEEKDLKTLKKQGSIVAELERSDDNRKRSIGLKF